VTALEFNSGAIPMDGDGEKVADDERTGTATSNS
jgi:hypothetical protein